jgi:hypothetical protein
MQRRKARPCLEALERREVLSSFTWNGSAGDGNWDNGANWAGGHAPTSGADIVFPNPSSAQTITLHPDDTGLELNSITVQGGSYTLQGPRKDASQILVLAAGASLDTQNGSSLAICPDRLSSPDANSLSLNLLGSTTKAGTGTLLLQNDVFLYNSSIAPPSLLPFHISGGTLTLGTSGGMTGSLVQLDTGTQLVIPDHLDPTVGSLSGSGTIQIGVNPGQTANTGLSIYTPSRESDVFGGVIDGQGGALEMAGLGSIMLGSVNASGAGLFNVAVTSGSLLVNGVLNAHQLLVSPGATFGGLATMNFSGLVILQSGATFAGVSNGTATGQFTHLTDTDTSDPTPVNLGGSTLSLSLGYVPAKGDSITIVSAAQAITGQFANAANGQTITVNGVTYNVNASSTSITLAVPAPVTGATQLSVSSQPTTPVPPGGTFNIVIDALNSGNTLASSYSGSVTLTLVPLSTNPPGAALVGQTTVSASGGVASFFGLSFNLPGSYIIQASAAGLSPANTLAITLSQQPPPAAQIILPPSVIFTQKKNKKGKSVGPKVLQGYQFTFNLPMSASVFNTGNYIVDAYMKVRVRVKVGKRTVTQTQTQLRPIGFSVNYVAATNSVQILTGKQTFPLGGQITLGTGLGDTAGGFLASPAVYNIARKGFGIG